MLCFATYLLSFILHGFTIYVIIESWDEKIVLSKIFVIMSIAASVVIGEWGNERKKYFQQICALSYSYVWLLLHNIHVITGGLYEKHKFTTTSTTYLLWKKQML